MQDLPFDCLLPDFILQAVESCGLTTDGRILALNSYENRVYQVGIELNQDESSDEYINDNFLIAKFYRPGRWSDDQILEEHEFCEELLKHEIPVLAPLSLATFVQYHPKIAYDPSINTTQDSETLFHYKGMRFAIYRRQGGHAPELDDSVRLKQVSRIIARIHSVGASRPYRKRPSLDLASYVSEGVELIKDQFIPQELRSTYVSLIEALSQKIEERFEMAGEVNLLRAHSDCHLGNMVLNREGQVYFLDFDDSRMAPAVQDIWMLFSGDREHRSRQLIDILAAYREFYDFDMKELYLIEALQSMRVMQYSGWLAKRWHDPAFPTSFPWFNTQSYWSGHIHLLREQLGSMEHSYFPTHLGQTLL